MERLLTNLERRFGRIAPDNLPWIIVGLTALGAAVRIVKPELTSAFTLDPGAIGRGELWRIVTFLFVPARGFDTFLGPLARPIIAFFMLSFLYTMTTSLEQEWGAFRFAFFYAVLALGTIAVGLLVGPVNSDGIYEAIFLSFALLFPDFEITLFPIPISVKVKWLGMVAAALLVWSFITGSWAERGAIAVAFGALLLFCSETVRARMRGVAGVQASRRRRSQYEDSFAPAPKKVRVCALCGKSDKDDPQLEFRVCDCQEKCKGKLTEYCLEHARNH